tara:strand:+ start:1679 stop:2698 length:1020 start_codon:yes stop_codon:yes gene_type:complete
MNSFDFDFVNNYNSYIIGTILFRSDIFDNKIESVFNQKLNDNIINSFKLLGNVVYELNKTKIIIDNIEILDNIKNWFYTKDLNYPNYVEFINNNENCIGFIKAFFEFYGNISKELYTSYVYISHKNIILINAIKDKINIPFEIINGENLYTIKYDNVNCIDFLGVLYNNIDNNMYDDLYYKKYLSIVNNIDNDELPILKIYKSSDNAILPSKNRNSDAGYDLTIINKVKKNNSKTTLYDTGIKLDIPNGYYIEVFPRSSISKSGYMLANSVGIIDQGYRGNIFIALTKIDENTPDLELPFKCCQMILKKQVYSIIKELNEDLSITDRNNGGFGSTNNQK